MSARTAPALTSSLLEATLDVLWRQWRAIGGAAAGGAVSKQVDPEALCLASLVLEQHEPRLGLTMADWLRLGAPLLSVQRARNLAAQFPNGEALLARVASAAVEAANDARWRPLLRRGPRARVPLRSVAKRRSAGPALDAPAALVLRLRAAFGVGVKADLLAFLLGQPYRVSVAGAAASLGYSTPTVFRAFQDFRAAGLVQSAELPAAVEFSLLMSQWHGVLGGQHALVRWGFWREILSYVCSVVRWEEETAKRPISEYARGVSLRDLVVHHEQGLVRAGVIEGSLALPRSAALDEWQAFHRQAAERVTALA